MVRTCMECKDSSETTMTLYAYVDLFVVRTNWTLARALAPAPSGLANLPAWARLDPAGIKIGDLHCENICSVSYELHTHTHTDALIRLGNWRSLC